MRTLHLHFGHAKTGTTAQQNWLAHNRDWLYARGWYYPQTAMKLGAGHTGFAKCFISRMPAGMRPAEGADAVKAAMAEELAASQAENILISSENFVLADAEPLAEFFSACLPGASIRIHYLVRSQDELAESQFNQLVKINWPGISRLSFETFAQDNAALFDFAAHASRWEKAFGAGTIRTAVYDAGGQASLTRLLELLEISPWDPNGPQPDMPELDLSNRALRLRAFAALRQLNGIELPDQTRLYRQIARKLDRNSPPALLFDSGWARTYRAGFAASNRAFSTRYLGGAREDLGGRRYSDAERDRFRCEAAGYLARQFSLPLSQ